MLSSTTAVVDSSTLINLAASGKLEEMISLIAQRCVVCRIVKRECLFIRSADGLQLEALDVEAWIQAGILGECELTELEEQRFVTHAAGLDDGEAMSLAVAETRGYSFVTDDRKACRLAAGLFVHTISTAAILREWAGRTGSQLADVLDLIELRARFRPRTTDPDYEWWMQHRRQR